MQHEPPPRLGVDVAAAVADLAELEEQLVPLAFQLPLASLCMSLMGSPERRTYPATCRTLVLREHSMLEALLQLE